MKKYLEFANASKEDLCLVLDVSPSMECQDLKPSRLEAAVHASSELITAKRAHAPADRVSLVSFASAAKLELPLTNVGEHVFGQALAGLSTRSSTNIGSGLQAAGRALGVPVNTYSNGLLQWILRIPSEARAEQGGKSLRSKRIILLSDGCSNVGPCALSVASDLKRQGVFISTVGVGGSSASAEFDEATMRAIASRTLEGKPSYAFIGDTEALVRRFKQLACHIQPLGA